MTPTPEAGEEPGQNRGNPTHVIHYTVDGEPQETTARELTANQILENAGLTVADHYLIQIKGKHRESYQDHGEQLIHLHEHATFISVFIGPTPVSDPARSAAAAFTAQLRELGYSPTEHVEGRVMFPYEVEVGRLAGTKVALGIQVPPDFPIQPPSGIHVSPRIHPIQPSGVHPTGGIHESPSFGTDWEYWSRPCHEWGTTRRRVADYMGFVRRLWASQ